MFHFISSNKYKMKNVNFGIILLVLLFMANSEDQTSQQIQLSTRSQNQCNTPRLLQTSAPASLSTSRTYTSRIARITQQLPAHKQWRDEILLGISTLPNLGHPSKSIIFGRDAAIIAVGDSFDDIYISAAQLGMCRVILIAQPTYFTNFTSTNTDSNVATLHANMKKWVTKNQFTSNTDFTKAQIYVTSTSVQTQIALYSTEESPATIYTTSQRIKLLNFVKNGGGLIVAASAYDWISTSYPRRDINNMLNYQILLQAGICMGRDQAYNSGQINTTKTNLELSHFSIQVNKALSPEVSAYNYSYDMSFLLSDLPTQYQTQLRKLVIAFIPRLFFYPSSSSTVRKTYDKMRLDLYFHTILQSGKPNVVALGYDKFPGKVDTTNPLFTYLQNQPFSFTSNKKSQQYYHTGLYAVAGQTVTVNLIKGSLIYPWQFLIGFHLYTGQSLYSGDWNRWSTVTYRSSLNQAFIDITSPFGGLIVLKSSQSLNQTVEINLSNVVEAPFFDSQISSSVTDWRRRRKAPGAWGIVQGKYVGFCFSRSSFVDIDDPSPIINLYDSILTAYYALRGLNPQIQTKKYFVSDVAFEPSGHSIIWTSIYAANPNVSGFPLNYDNTLLNGNWYHFQKLGGQLMSEKWTLDSDKVLSKVFALKGMEISTGKRPKYAPWFVSQKNNLQGYLANPNFVTWKSSSGIAIGIYVQLIEDFGWSTLQKVLTWYETNTSSATAQAKIDLFWSRYSIEAGENLTPLLTKWSIPFTTNFTTAVSALPTYTEKVNIFV